MLSDGILEAGRSAHSPEPPNTANPPALCFHPTGSGIGGDLRPDGGALVLKRRHTLSFDRRQRRRRCAFVAGFQAGIRVWSGAPGLQLVQNSNKTLQEIPVEPDRQETLERDEPMSGGYGHEAGHQQTVDQMGEEEKKREEEGKADSFVAKATTTVVQEQKEGGAAEEVSDIQALIPTTVLQVPVPHESDQQQPDVKISDLDEETVLEEKLRQYRHQHAILHCQMPRPSLGEQQEQDCEKPQSFPGLAFLTLGEGFDMAATSRRHYWYLYDLFQLAPPDAYDG
ncbi:unnamed protein product [Polarella glacialis]|uniref:Uncharacterized protein n=1 Tax=Polarella glacialis TaxID=89957 RepID=A0A813F9U3_POLGL|nr:unnamed protein product [Polarella glacialis]CAE8622854.1 unnamed protein product [Polarella glacialis]|mmetsp:Transcript_74032/g.119462  ORF Transcript_74032/g.119462 Transcript_74032/m.119462 type:complete len:283 (-) Transcript_74032:151-999(-)